MASFPSVSFNPDIGSWEESKAFDPTIRTTSFSGYTVTRPKCTRVPMTWKITYSLLTDVEKDLFVAFEGDLLVGSDSFTWTHPISGSYTVRLKDRIKYKMDGSPVQWRVELNLEEV